MARAGLLAEVTIDQVGQCGDGFVRLWPLGADHDVRPLAYPEREDAQDALRISHGAIFIHLDLRVLEPRRGLHEERRRTRMQANLVRDRQRMFGYRLPRLLMGSTGCGTPPVVCDQASHRSRSQSV